MDMTVWKLINKCLICGTKLKFEPADDFAKAKRGEGKKTCEQNHKRFVIFGQYNDSGTFDMKMMLPNGKFTSWTVS